MSEVAIATPNPDENELNALMRQAEIVAKSKIVPQAYRGMPAELLAAALMGRAFGWDLISSTRFVQVIQGTATIKPEAMLALIRSRGHSVQITRQADGVTVKGTRADTGDTDTVSFTLADAERAGLTRNPTWKQYPIDMCQWRAVSRLARSLFSEVTLGAGYVPEEIGLAKNDAAALVVDVETGEVSGRDWLGEAKALAAAEDLEGLRALHAEARRARVDADVDAEIVALGKALADKIADADAEVVDAEVVEDTTEDDTEDTTNEWAVEDPFAAPAEDAA